VTVGARPRVRVRLRRQRGIALIVVLWVVFLLAIISQSFTVEVRTGLQLTHNLVQSGKARAMADGAIYRAIDTLIRRRNDRTYAADGQPATMSVPDGTVEVAIQDEAGKIDLNLAPRALLEGLFRSVSLEEDAAEALVDSIADWTDPDDRRRKRGAENADYQQAGLAWGPKNGRFDSVDEFGLVLGITRDIFDAVAPALTVYSGKRGIDVAVAPPLALRALSADDPSRAESLLAARGEDDPARLNAAFNDLGPSKRFVSKSARTTFSIRATARPEGGGVFVREAIVRVGRGTPLPYTILDWR